MSVGAWNLRSPLGIHAAAWLGLLLASAHGQPPPPCTSFGPLRDKLLNRGRNWHRIAFFIPWAGPWPSYAPRFLQSAASNHRIADFHFLIANGTSDPRSEAKRRGHRFEMSNIFVQCFGGLHDLEEQVSRRLGIRVLISRPYVMVDLKPTFGHLFREELRAAGYTHWAWCDIDMLLGDIGSNLSEQDWRRSIVTFRPGAQDPSFDGGLTIARNEHRLSKVMALGHPAVKELLAGANLGSNLAHYTEMGAPAHFFSRCDPAFDIAIHAIKLVSDWAFKFNGIRFVDRTFNLTWDPIAPALFSEVPSEAFIREQDEVVSIRPERPPVFTAHLKRPGALTGSAPDIYVGYGNFAPGTLVRSNCSWFRERVEPKASRRGSRIAYHFVLTKRHFVDCVTPRCLDPKREFVISADVGYGKRLQLLEYA